MYPWHIYQFLLFLAVGYVVSISLFKATIRKTKHSKA